MIIFLTFLLLSLAVYACLKWWFDTSLLDHFSKVVCKHNFSDVKRYLSSNGKFGKLLVELFECPWCLAFHFALWLNLISFLSFDINFTVIFHFILASAGGGMFLYQQDLKD